MRPRWMCAPMMILCLILAACGGESGGQAEQLALDIRGEYLEMASCAGRTEVIADYGQRVYEYGISFQWEREGDLVLTVTAPVEAAGITARVSGEQTSLEYDGVRLETGPLNEDGLSPIDAIPALLRALREDFIAECGMEKLGETHTLRLCCRAPGKHGRRGGGDHPVASSGDPCPAPGRGVSGRLYGHTMHLYRIYRRVREALSRRCRERTITNER